MYLSKSKIQKQPIETNLPESLEKSTIEKNLKNNEAINQIKNVTQEKKIKSEVHRDVKGQNKISINSFSELVNYCLEKKEMKLKYELEKNVNLVKFENGRIEISFNDSLDKNFVKDLSTKLLEWTNKRWIISFSKNKGEISVKEKEKNKQLELIANAKKTDLYKTMLDYFPDAELIDIKTIKKKDE